MVADTDAWPPTPIPADHDPATGPFKNIVDLKLRYVLALADRMLAPTEAIAVIVVNKMDAVGLPRPGSLAVDICPIDADAITKRLADAPSYLVWDRFAAEFLPEPLPA